MSDYVLIDNAGPLQQGRGRNRIDDKACLAFMATHLAANADETPTEAARMWMETNNPRRHSDKAFIERLRDKFNAQREASV